MILNLGSLSFNTKLEKGSGTPAWGTELGQGDGYRFNFEDTEPFLTSMVYMSIPDIEQITCPLGKGSNSQDDYDFVLASVYDKVYVNGNRIPNSKFILLIIKKIVGDHHIGRRTLKYNPKMTYHGIAYNEQCFEQIPSVLGIANDAAWFIDEIYTNNQDELHFTAYVLDSQGPKSYIDTNERKQDFQSKIETDKTTNRHTRRIRFNNDNQYSLQQIYYGAPGTGKSHAIKDLTEKYPQDDIIRTTFHPDSDYATFVGCYKPSMKAVKQTYIVEGEQKPVLDVQTREQVSKQEIVYDYSAQAFTQAYTRAWLNPNTPVFLIIEEINRGNCAQIFGDLFQLLDRNENGESEYPIHTDNDLQRYLEQTFKDCEIDDEKIKNGTKLKLPSNLYIWATMNTSDQSLFPIDSAFKRRWDWKYIPISDAKQEYVIKVGEETFDWWQFLQAINEKIYEATQSEDKQMGYFFVKPNGTEITKDMFVDKVVFYLWNDVFKDYPCEDIFSQGHKFHDFFDPQGNAKPDEVIAFIRRILPTTAE